MLDASEENMNTLALLGLGPEAAEKALAYRVCLTVGPGAEVFAQDIANLLARTLTVVSPNANPDLEVAVCTAPQDCAAKALTVLLERGAVTIAPPGLISPSFAETPGLTRRVAACYVASRVIGFVTDSAQYTAVPDPFVVSFAALGLDPGLLARSIELEDAVLVGAGGVGNGFVWGLETLDLRGTLTILDPKDVADGNLNRCLFFGETDKGKPKAEQLAKNSHTPGLKLEPKKASFDDLIRERGRIGLAISTVDSRQVRRSIQSGLPWEVLDASTTGISEVVVHSHGQRAQGACLACIYEHIPLEDARQRDMARGLGLDVEDLERGLIDREIAQKIMLAHPDAKVADLVGRAFDSIFRERCGQGALKTAGGEQVFAPFAFISNLAGLLLALELVRLKHSPDWGRASHYMTLDPWRPPHSKLRRLRSRSPTCQHCNDQFLAQAMRSVWPERFATAP